MAGEQPKYLTRDEDYKWKHGINYRENPHLYHSGRGQQGVTICEPYKSEIGQYWRFKTPEIAERSATKIYEMFLDYLKQDDFIGADMCKKFIHMGFTRARRYANHRSGRKWQLKGKEWSVLPLETDRDRSPKAIAANIFHDFWVLARNNDKYLKLKKAHKKKYWS